MLTETLAPEPAELDVGLGDALVSEKKPGPENGLSEDVKDGVGDYLLVNIHDVRAVSDTPNAEETSALLLE